VIWTPIIAGMCAFMFHAHGGDYVTIGTVVDEACDPFLTVSDGTSLPPFPDFDHAVHVEIGKDGARLTIDDKNFFVPRSDGA
jgi:hypothetical protein